MKRLCMLWLVCMVQIAQAQDAKPAPIPAPIVEPEKPSLPKALTEKQQIEWLKAINAANVAELWVRRIEDEVKAEREKRMAAHEKAVKEAMAKLADLRKAANAPATCSLTDTAAWKCEPQEQPKK